MSPILTAPGAVPQASDHRLRPAQQARGNARTPRLHRAGLVDLREALGLRQGRSGLRRERRPDRRPLRRAGHASAVARTHRRSGQRPPRMAHADPVVAAGRQPARGLPEALRTGRHRSGTRPDPGGNRQHPRSRAGTGASACRPASACRTAIVVSDYLDSVREIERRVQMAEKADNTRADVFRMRRSARRTISPSISS